MKGIILQLFVDNFSSLLQVQLPLGRREARFSMVDGDFKVRSDSGGYTIFCAWYLVQPLHTR
jgi:hypothetical protein